MQPPARQVFEPVDYAEPPVQPPAPEIAGPVFYEEDAPVIAEPVFYKEDAPPPARQAPDPVDYEYEEEDLPVTYREQPAESILTDEQLRVLNRKHLLMMIRDLEKELRQAKKERDLLLVAYEAGLAKRKRTP